MNKQETYNRVKEHLLAQGKQSQAQAEKPGFFSIEVTWCLYRGPNGTKCAIGALIPDEKYDERMENCTVVQLLIRWPGCLDPKLGQVDLSSLEEVTFLNDLQRIHDGFRPELWADELTNFARARGLTP